MSAELFNLLDEIEEEKGIKIRTLCWTRLKAALISAYKKNFGAVEDINVKFSDDGDIRIFARKEVVEEVEDRETQISLEDSSKN